MTSHGTQMHPHPARNRVTVRPTTTHPPTALAPLSPAPRRLLRSPRPNSAIAPMLWKTHSPELFDTFSAGRVMLRLAVPSLRSAKAIKGFQTDFEACGSLGEWCALESLSAKRSLLRLGSSRHYARVQSRCHRHCCFAIPKCAVGRRRAWNVRRRDRHGSASGSDEILSGRGGAVRFSHFKSHFPFLARAKSEPPCVSQRTASCAPASITSFGHPQLLCAW